VFIELTEFLRCPKDHEEAHAVCLPLEMAGRDVVRGVVGCPACQAEYAIVDGVVDFAESTSTPGHRGTEAPRDAGPSRGGAGDDSGASVRRCAGAPAAQLTADALATILDLRGPGGFLLLAGAAARLAADLVPLVPDVHVVCVNGPEAAVRTPGCSFLRAPGRFPLTTSSMRAVVLGGAAAVEPWLAEGVRVLLRGLRLVLEDERASPAGVAELARGAGLFVGEKRDR
jgi:uncharacterized protein YbaR (Trm112 family)